MMQQAGHNGIAGPHFFANLAARALGIYNSGDVGQGIAQRFKRFVVPSGERRGLWHDPLSLFTMLWEMTPELVAQRVSSLLEVGTFSGHGFFAVKTFLEGVLGQTTLRAKTLDVTPLDPASPMTPHIGGDFVQGTSLTVRGQPYDLVLVDGSTMPVDVAIDFAQVAPTSKFVILLSAMFQPANGEAMSKPIVDALKGYEVRMMPYGPSKYVVPVVLTHKGKH